MPLNNYSDPSMADQKFTFDETGLTNPQYTVPRVFNELLDRSNIPVTRRYYWYRSQVTPWEGHSTRSNIPAAWRCICC